MNPIKNKGNNTQTCDFLITLLLFTGSVHVTSGSYLHLLHLYGGNYREFLLSRNQPWGECFHHGNEELDRSGSHATPTPAPVVKNVPVYPLESVHIVTPSLPGFAGQTSGLRSWILHAAEHGPFCTRSFIIVFVPVFSGRFSKLRHIICCLSNRNSDSVSIFLWDWNVSAVITWRSVVTVSRETWRYIFIFPTLNDLDSYEVLVVLLWWLVKSLLD